MRSDLAAAPFSTTDPLDGAFKIGEIEPIITAAGDKTRIAPLIILLAVGSEMDAAHFRLAGESFVVTDKSLPQVFCVASLENALSKLNSTR